MSGRPQHRVLSLVLYAMVLASIQYFVVDTGFTPNENAIWFYTGIASLLFGSRLLNPHYTGPADAATNGFFAFAGMVAGSLAVPSGSADQFVLIAVALFCALLSIASLVVLLNRVQIGIETRAWINIVDHVVRGLGSPSVVFTIVILSAVWLFHRSAPLEVFAIVSIWATIVALQPIEAIVRFLAWLNRDAPPAFLDSYVGAIAAHQSPGIVLVRQDTEKNIAFGSPLIVADDNGPWMLGVALNYVGRDEGHLLRVLTATLPQALRARVASISPPKGNGIAFLIDAQANELEGIRAIEWIGRLCGLVDSDTNLEHLQFEVVSESGLTEGRLVEVRIGDDMVIFQVIDGLTREDIVQQKNKYGYARAKARKIGKWNSDQRQFEPIKWMPNINAPVFLVEEAEAEFDLDCIGCFPRTNYGVSIDVNELVTHNTAILGILGIGKSYLAIELVDRMIAEGIKVICLDLTNQYALRLADYLDEGFETVRKEQLRVAGAGGVAHQNKEQGGSHRAFRAEVLTQVRELLNPASARFLKIWNPSQFEVTRQASGMYAGNADMATLTPCEITAIVSDVALEVCQELGMTDQGRLCLIYEEAHSLVPEWNSVVADGDKSATARSARAILQGRKYGLGCILVTQRTANVTKTILNQCNTIFAMRTFDDTGKEFLSNYIGADYASVLPSVESRHAVVFGKASSCSNPVLIKLNDRDDFIAGFRAANPIRPLPVFPAVAAVNAAQNDDMDDEIPF